jgi:abortive infection bacteriophage resistance protein
MSSYAKRHLTYVEQVGLLEQRGLRIDDQAGAAAALERFGYYRLAGYWVPFRDPASGMFRQDVSFDDVLKLYEYDKSLRLLVLSGLERIEVATRVRIAHHLGQKDAFALERPELLDRRFATGGYATWYLRYQDSVSKTTDRFVHEFMAQYGQPLPIWLGIELWDFGLLSRFYQGMKFKDRDSIAAGVGLQDGRVMKSWLHSMSVTRNICAHHGRFWNRTLARPMSLPERGTAPELDHLRRLSPVDGHRQYPALCAIAYLLGKLDPHSSWRQAAISQLLNFPRIPSIDLSDMGFPAGWQDLNVWTVERKSVADGSRKPE